LDAAPRQPLDPETARNCLLTNLLVLPGFGSLMGGRKIGWLQIVLAIIGFVMTPVYFIGAAPEWIRTGHFVCEFNRYLVLSFVGILLFLIAWVWGLATGLAIRRSARPQ
jgi:hypothetical protein